MRKLLIVFGLLLMSSGASAEETREMYKDDKKKFCSLLHYRVLSSYVAYRDKSNDRSYQEFALEMGAKHATIYTALCQD